MEFMTSFTPTMIPIIRDMRQFFSGLLQIALGKLGTIINIIILIRT